MEKVKISFEVDFVAKHNRWSTVVTTGEIDGHIWMIGDLQIWIKRC